jgi:pimeloyl-ACP methyl ester carboxylesterase
LQRRSTSGDVAARYMEGVTDFDVTDLLPKVKAPTLVMHARGDLVIPFKAGQRMAAGIPGARFVAMQGNNHLFQEYEPANERFFEELRLFLRA